MKDPLDVDVAFLRERLHDRIDHYDDADDLGYFPTMYNAPHNGILLEIGNDDTDDKKLFVITIEEYTE